MLSLCFVNVCVFECLIIDSSSSLPWGYIYYRAVNRVSNPPPPFFKSRNRFRSRNRSLHILPAVSLLLTKNCSNTSLLRVKLPPSGTFKKAHFTSVWDVSTSMTRLVVAGFVVVVLMRLVLDNVEQVFMSLKFISCFVKVASNDYCHYLLLYCVFIISVWSFNGSVVDNLCF